MIRLPIKVPKGYRYLEIDQQLKYDKFALDGSLKGCKLSFLKRWSTTFGGIHHIIAEKPKNSLLSSALSFNRKEMV
jgi:hypothetical protein